MRYSRDIYIPSKKDRQRQYPPVRANERRPPLRSFRELAVEFGVTEVSLRGFMGAAPPDLRPPKPRMQHARGLRYYDRQEFREWWRKLHELRQKRPAGEAGQGKEVS